jgi:hypothetical protein
MAAVIACFVSLLGPLQVMATTKTLSADELAAAMAERAAYGLPADDASVAAALSQGVDAGLSEWGMVVTDEELKALDMEGRTEFDGLADQGVVPYARSLANYAGAYLDQRGDGSLTVLLTSMAGADEILRLAPSGKRPVRVQLAKYSYSVLMDALLHIRDTWAGLYPNVELLNVAIESRENRLRAEVDESQMAKVDANLTELVADLGVPVHLAPGVEAVPATCYPRDNCYNPIKAATWINSDGSPSESCALGFWVSNHSGDEQFVTAGHCSGPAPSSVDCWYQRNAAGTGYGFIGCQVAGLNWYYGGQYDMMIVYGPDSQATNMIYAEARRITSFAYPVTGDFVCASLTKSNTIDCGSVTDDFVSYTMNGYSFYGGSYSGISIIGGDSGSPVYRRVSATSANIFGVVSGGAYFTLTTGVLQNNGYTVVNW